MSDSYYVSGSFSEKYGILQHIGKGAYGCVKKAFRNEDGLLVSIVSELIFYVPWHIVKME